MAVWCVRRRVCVVEAHKPMGDGVVETEGTTNIGCSTEPIETEKKCVIGESGWEGQSDSRLMNLISCSPECILTPITHGQGVQQTCSNPTQGVQNGRPTAPVVEMVENG